MAEGIAQTLFTTGNFRLVATCMDDATGDLRREMTAMGPTIVIYGAAGGSGPLGKVSISETNPAILPDLGCWYLADRHLP